MSAGTTLSFALTVGNAGNVDGAGPADVAVYRSADGVALTVPVSTVTKPLTVKPGESVAVRLKVKVPAGTAAGAFYPLVTVSQGTAVPSTAAAMTTVTVG